MRCTIIQSSTVLPFNLIAVGYVFNTYGVRGWIKVKPYAMDNTILLDVKNWWLNKPKFNLFKEVRTKYHGGNVLAKLIGINTCNAAKTLKDAIVFIPRNYFPSLNNNEFYWIDLIGLEVENLRAQYLGIIKDLINNNAHTILRVVLPQKQIIDKKKIINEILIPFVDPIIQSVQMTEKKVIVDWQLHY